MSNLLQLMDSPLKLREMVADEAVGATYAIELIKEHGGETALEMLSAALERKAEAGKPSRVTKKDVAPATKFNKFVKKSVPALYSTLSGVTKDPGFAGLSPELQHSLKELFDEIEKTRGDGGADAEDARQNKLFDGGDVAKT